MFPTFLSVCSVILVHLAAILVASDEQHKNRGKADGSYENGLEKSGRVSDSFEA
jgi:hypothetical protein